MGEWVKIGEKEGIRWDDKEEGMKKGARKEMEKEDGM